MKKMQGTDKNLSIFNTTTTVTNQKGYEKPAWFESLWGRSPSNTKPTKPQDIELGTVTSNKSASSSLWSSWTSQEIETTTATNDGKSGIFSSIT
jgi:hypothetical protein